MHYHNYCIHHITNGTTLLILKRKVVLYDHAKTLNCLHLRAGCLCVHMCVYVWMYVCVCVMRERERGREKQRVRNACFPFHSFAAE